MAKKYWLMKSEPDVFSIEDLKERGSEAWDGVRNYQARNFMRDEMQVGDGVLFYHSNCKEPGIAGIATVSSKPYDDPTALDPKSNYYDPKSTPEKNRWQLIEVSYQETFPKVVTLADMKEDAKLADMRILQKGNRLSITPVTKEQFDYIKKLSKA